MLHHTGGTSSSLSQVKYLALNKAQVSCNYVIGRDGHIRQIADDKKSTRHAGYGSRDGIVNSMNFHSIGIEVVSDGNSFTEQQRDSVKELVKHLMDLYSIPLDNIIRHKDYAPNRKVDIGDGIWSNRYKSREEYRESFLGVDKDQELLDRLIEDGYWNGKEGGGVTRRVALLIAKVKYL